MIQSYYSLKLKDDFIAVLEDVKELKRDISILKNEIKDIKEKSLFDHYNLNENL